MHGHYDSDDRLSPSVLQAPEEFASSTIVMVSAGEYHTVAVGECGAVWSWGVGSTGQLGLGSLFTAPLPTLVGAEVVFGGSKPHLAVCGSCHTLVVTEAGAVWACGQGGSGALGLNDTLPRFVPTRIDQKRFAHARVVTLAAGVYHSAAVTRGTQRRRLHLGKRKRLLQSGSARRARPRGSAQQTGARTRLARPSGWPCRALPWPG